MSSWPAYSALHGPAALPLLSVALATIALAAAGIVLAPAAGLTALAAFHIQPLIALAGGPFRPRDLTLAVLLRLPQTLFDLLRLLWAGVRQQERISQVEDLRPIYAELYAERERFFEPALTRCPLCDSDSLGKRLEVPDLFQSKPGRFRLDACSRCGHIFQNPRLSPKGLEYYYRDFYDGLGRQDAELFFCGGVKNQRDQIQTIAEHCHPQSWLDVGGGHGHLCLLAREHFPEARFAALDVSESVEEAERRGWIDEGYRGFFPEKASELEGRFDVVTMCHYLEHAIDPRAELAAARQALAPGGLLYIEVPDPEAPWAARLGRYWMPWFQPQHLHLLSSDNLEKLLWEAGLEPVTRLPISDRAHVIVLLSGVLLLHELAPPSNVPWRPPASFPVRLRSIAISLIAVPTLLLAVVATRIFAKAFRLKKIRHSYRMIARTPPRESASSDSAEKSD